VPESKSLEIAHYFGFGLIHGLGFATALSEIGILKIFFPRYYLSI
jgi:hypothetical protein